ncbi:MAG: response regulator, partial [Deltaproteobacteria bacterium]|nr:response regulator [Deltaproteobacteria bacterium]
RPGELVGQRFDKLVHPDDLDTTVECFGPTLEGRACSGEFRVLHADGSERVMRASVRPILERGKVVGVTGFGIDVTEQRRTEEQLRAAMKMEAVGRLAGGVAHDFNNVLTVIKSYTEMAISDLREDHPIQPDLKEVHAAAERAAALTRQLLAFSRKQVLEIVVVDLNALVTDMRRMLSRLIGEDIAIDLRPAHDLWPVKADAGQLEQVVMNLAVNARDAMPRGGRLVIETRNVQSAGDDGLPPGEWVMLGVTDNGVGMSPDVAARVFEPFFTTKATGKGTGLGLATVYGIVTQSDGHITVESAPGQGTTFRVLLPRTHDALPAREWRDVPLVSVRGHETLLLVEDEEPVRRLVGRILTNAGYRVIEAANGDDALRMSERMRCEIPLVVSDVVMPGVHGLELEERLRALCPNVRILFMSGYDQDEVAVRVSERPRTEFLQKPFQKRELLEKVRRILDHPYPCLAEPDRTSCPDPPRRPR